MQKYTTQRKLHDESPMNYITNQIVIDKTILIDRLMIDCWTKWV